MQALQILPPLDVGAVGGSLPFGDGLGVLVVLGGGGGAVGGAGEVAELVVADAEVALPSGVGGIGCGACCDLSVQHPHELGGPRSCCWR